MTVEGIHGVACLCVCTGMCTWFYLGTPTIQPGTFTQLQMVLITPPNRHISTVLQLPIIFGIVLGQQLRPTMHKTHGHIYKLVGKWPMSEYCSVYIVHVHITDLSP